MNKGLVEYYNKRAAEYERIYLKPERQEDILSAGTLLKDLVKGKEVIEIACGTGYWTAFLAQSCHSILATDINETVLEIARSKKIPHNKLAFEKKDLYEIVPERKFECLFGGFIWSHILKQDLEGFYNTIHSLVKPGGLVVLMDNLYVKGSNLPVSYTDQDGNTFQKRLLEDGTTHQVLKNFATEDFLKKSLGNKVSEFRFTPLQYFWILTYRTIQ